MKFTLLERIVLPSILPSQGSYTDLIHRQEIIDKVKITGEEIDKYEIKEMENGIIVWNKSGGEQEFDISFSDLESSYIKEKLNKMNDEKSLTVQNLSLYKKFCL